jgi:hypothetical protein
MWPTMTGGQVIEVANFTVFTVFLSNEQQVMCWHIPPLLLFMSLG